MRRDIYIAGTLAIGRAGIDAAEAKYRGEIEEPLKCVLQDLKSSARTVTLFYL
jgi:hypothetical protein